MLFALSVSMHAGPAIAGDFDSIGNFVPDPSAVGFIDFGDDFDAELDRYVPMDNPPECGPVGFVEVETADALSGTHVLGVETLLSKGCAERLLIRGVPKAKGSYRATVWARHGGISAQLTVLYPVDSGQDIELAKLAPTGRTTTDGWVELASNALPIDGELALAVYLRVIDFDSVGSHLDALELVPDGEYVAAAVCSGTGDPVCGTERVCLHGACRLGRSYVPPLPHESVRDAVVDTIAGQLQTFFGGRKTRLSDLPAALLHIESMRSAKTAWEFWQSWGHGVRRLHDWHTHTMGGIDVFNRAKRLNACFIAGDADISIGVWPKDAKYPDVLVSHTGNDGTAGLHRGDRLVAVDGVHPIAWALGLARVDWSWWQACDDRVVSELYERMRGLILEHASTFSVLTCDAMTASCDPIPKTIVVADLPPDTGGQVNCDNRPAYYFEDNNPPAHHGIWWDFYSGRVAGTTPEEAIYGLIWDTLYGGGDPKGHVNSNLKKAFTKFKADARAVILDHRAGSGGTLDGAETATELLRTPSVRLVFRSPIERGGDDGPATVAEGLAIFSKYKYASPFTVGSKDWATKMPVAILIHRDGSASDFFPFG
ncbi:MAG: hypothetical protein EXR75_14355, partial [Myxococcales bacterium]|nr:hypothetical protein [Myxococcales bacterium]